MVIQVVYNARLDMGMVTRFVIGWAVLNFAIMDLKVSLIEKGALFSLFLIYSKFLKIEILPYP